MAQAGGKAVLVEINSETDFVAKDANFIAFADTIAQAALASGVADAEALKSVALPSGETVEEARAAAIAKLGENIQPLARSRKIGGTCHSSASVKAFRQLKAAFQVLPG